VYWAILTVFGSLGLGRMAAAHSALYIAELALLGKESVLLEAFLALGGGVLLARNNPSPLVHEQITLDEFAGSLVGSSVHHLLARTNEIGEFMTVNVVMSVFVA